MGSFYGSIQVRLDDHAAVKDAAEKVGRTQNVRMLVGPVIEGWVGLYPDMNGQSELAGAAVAAQLDADVLHLIVHDSDIFAYWYYQRGELIDSFWSAPGYFGEENLPQEEAMAGNVEAFRPIVGDRVKRLAKLSRRGEEQELDAESHLAEFAKVLKISNVLTAYDYLKSGEIEGVKKWKQFSEVPSERVAEAKQDARKRRSEVEAARKQFKSNGVLLLHEERKVGGAPYGCAVEHGFVVAWADYQARSVSFATLEPSWEKVRPLELGTLKHLTGLASDATNSRVAMSAGDRVQIWDVADGNWSHVVDILESDLTIAAAISADGKLVAHASREKIVVTDIMSNKTICTVPHSDVRRLTFHPDGEWLAVSGQSFGFVSIRSEPAWRDIYFGGKRELPPQMAFNSQELQNIDWEEMERKQRVEMEKVIKQLERSSRRSKQPAMSDAQIQGLRDEMERSIRETREKIAEWQVRGWPETPRQPNQIVHCAAFSRDGKWLFCGTDRGFYALLWESVPRQAGADLVEVTWKCEFQGRDEFGCPDSVWAIAEELDSPAVVFGGSAGRLHRLELESGQLRDLVKLPGEAWVVDLAMSADGTALGAAVMSMPFSEAARERHDRTPSWQVWSYTKLRG
jgi:hypothetical protein